MKPQGKGRLQIDVCEQCGGFFVHLGQEAAGQLEKLLRKGLENGTGGSTEEAMVSPSSGLLMKGFEFRGVHLDYCADSNSIWFDRGEYPKIFATPGKAVSKPSNGDPKNTVADVAVSSVDVVGGGVEIASDVIGGVGDFLGDLLSGLSPF